MNERSKTEPMAVVKTIASTVKSFFEPKASADDWNDPASESRGNALSEARAPRRAIITHTTAQPGADNLAPGNGSRFDPNLGSKPHFVPRVQVSIPPATEQFISEICRQAAEQLGFVVLQPKDREQLDEATAKLDEQQGFRVKFSGLAATEAYWKQHQILRTHIDGGGNPDDMRMPSREEIWHDFYRKNKAYSEAQGRVTQSIVATVEKVARRYAQAAELVAREVERSEQEMASRFGGLWTSSGNSTSAIRRSVAEVQRRAGETAGYVDRPYWPVMALKGIYTPSGE